MSISKLNKIKSGKKWTEVTLNLSSNLIGNSETNFDENYDQTNFPHKLILTNIQVSKIRKAFANSSLADMKFWQTQLTKVQSGGFVYPEYYNKFPLLKIINSVANSFEKELKNADRKELYSNLIGIKLM